MEDENITLESLSDESHVNSPDEEGTAQSVPASDAMTLSEINALTGKNFPSKEAFLKSYKDTISYVGKKREDVEREVLSKIDNSSKIDQLAKELEQERIERFYDRNPQYADTTIRKFIESTGKKPSEVVDTPEFKSIFEKISGYDESQKLKTVLESNPRLASSRDSITRARELASKQDRPSEEVENLLVNAVKDAYDLN